MLPTSGVCCVLVWQASSWDVAANIFRQRPCYSQNCIRLYGLDCLDSFGNCFILTDGSGRLSCAVVLEDDMRELLSIF
jgi:hypothetical protein